ncbi:MAG: ABC transporter permease [Gemmatimonadaceae bacterium]|nr:ABC transporter permease [Gemmatimonadaceae bacterium]
MTFLLGLAWRSLRNRRLISLLTAASIALSVALLVGIEHVRLGVRESFAGTIKGTDLIVGARGGTTQVLLSTVFGMATPSGTVSWATYERWAAHPAIKWTIPYALGDAHKGHRVIGTTAAFFAHYRFRDRSVTFASGGPPTDDRSIAIGWDVAQRLGYAVGTKVVLSHGVAAVSFAEHEAHPFTVSGVIARTFTPIDRALYTTLDGLTAMHEDEEAAGGLMMGPPEAGHVPGQAPPITAFLVGTKNRFETLALQREMNEDRTEPLTAIIPGVALAQLWQTIGSAEVGLRVVALFTVLVGLTGMCVALYASLEARRREMAILRAVGAGPRTIVALLVLESALLAVLGAAAGVAIVYAGIALAAGAVEARFGLALTLRPLGALEWGYLALVVGAGTLVGLLPAWRAYRTSLTDGLAPKV